MIIALKLTSTSCRSTVLLLSARERFSAHLSPACCASNCRRPPRKQDSVMSNRVGLRRLLAAALLVVCACAVVGTALAAGPGGGAAGHERLAGLLKREGAVAQLVRGPGSVGGRELVVGADWLSVGDPAGEGETVEFWAHPRRGVRDRDRRITLSWGASFVRFRRALASEKWSHVSVSWDETRVRLDLDGQTIESYGLGEPSGVAEPHRLSVGRGALTSSPSLGRPLQQLDRRAFGRTPLPRRPPLMRPSPIRLPAGVAG